MVVLPLNEKERSTRVDLRQLRVAHEASHALRDVVALAHNRILENLTIPVFMDGAAGYFDPDKCCLVSSGIFTRSIKLVVELNCLFPQLVADAVCRLFENMLKMGIYNDVPYHPYRYISEDECRPTGRAPQSAAETRFLLRRCGGAGGGICGVVATAAAARLNSHTRIADMRTVERLREKLKAGVYLESAAALLRMPSTRRTYERLSGFFEIRYFRVGFRGLIGRHLEMSEYPLGGEVYDHDCGLDVHVPDRYLMFLRWMYAAACYDPDCPELSMDSRIPSLNQVVFGSDWSCYLTVRTMVEAYFHEIRLRRSESKLYHKFLQNTTCSSRKQYQDFVQELRLHKFHNTHPSSSSQNQHSHSHFLDREAATLYRTDSTTSTETTATDQPINGEFIAPSQIFYSKDLGLYSNTIDLPEFDTQRPYTILQNVPRTDPDYQILRTLCMLYDLPVTKNIQTRHRTWISALLERHPSIDLELAMATLDVYVVHSRVTPGILHHYAQSLQESFAQLTPFLPKLLTELANIDEWLDFPPLANERHFQIIR
ncbi:hypothetical protein TRICI_004384 [Trichomonascus ciferrii]|uniref:Uncharacterized protein n=1 Tax=Trichomonascus ciferrii TaxID=44093 RepID=A0A642V183_9ASCO|nr:hypothetical protein TRICI_004384 [Trichomonascus ciferrii]